MIVFPIAGNNFPTSGSRDIHTNGPWDRYEAKGLKTDEFFKKFNCIWPATKISSRLPLEAISLQTRMPHLCLASCILFSYFSR